MADYAAALTGFAALDEAALDRPWTWRDATMSARFALYRTLEDAQEVAVRIAAAPHPESRRILALAQRAFGELRGLLLGVPDALLDTPPRESAWTLRETLHHVLVIERRYAVQTRYAVDRSEADPVRIPEDRLPTPASLPNTGDVAALLARLGAARAESARLLEDLPPAALTRPMRWVHYAVDVRFRLHRFAAHIAEHAVQCEKTLAAVGWPPTEGRRIARLVAAAIGEVEGLGALAEARELEGRLVERFASVAA
ncbi:MAG: DinB family protein [Candidatus Rokubacteria bacterium]|nr:DinB family protein [Candidatus Rokubacteria bacterium]